MTRFEQIKAMDVDELAKRLNDDGIMTDAICQGIVNCPYMTDDVDISKYTAFDCDCTACVKKWLESEVEGNET